IQKSSAAERNHVRAAAFDDAHPIAQRGGLEHAERGLAVSVEDFRDGRLRALLDVRIQVAEIPTEFIGQRAADRRLARSHEPHKVDSGAPLEFENHPVGVERLLKVIMVTCSRACCPFFPFKWCCSPAPNCLCTFSKSGTRK